MCDKGFDWNPSNCACECDKLCDVGEYLDYKNSKSSKKLVDKFWYFLDKNLNISHIFAMVFMIWCKKL